MKYIFLIISMLPFLAFGQDTTTVKDGSRFNIVIDGNVTIEQVTDADVYESPMLHDIQWGTTGAHTDSTYSLDLSFKSAADKVDFQLVCGTQLAVQGGWLPQTTGRNGFVEHTFTLSCQDDIQIHFEASTAAKIYSISEHIPAFALQLTEAEQAWVDSVKKKTDLEMGYFSITNDSLQWTNAGHDNAVFLLDHPSVPAEFWNNVSADGGNIRVYHWDGSTETAVAREIVDVDTVGKTGQIYFDSSNSLADTANEWRVYTEAGATEPAFTDPLGRNAVWSNYLAVLHMNQDPSGTAPQILDSTANEYDGTSSGSMTSSDLASGKLGGALYFDGVDDNISIGNAFHINRLTVSAWSYYDDASQTDPDGAIVGKWDDGAESWLLWNNDGNISLLLKSPSSGNISSGTATIPNNTWTHYAGVYDGTSVELYQNGIVVSGGGSYSGDINVGTAEIAIHEYSINKSLSLTLFGGADEVRISSTPFSPDHISTEYNNQSNPTSFWTVSAWQSTSTTTALSGSINIQLALSGETKESATLAGQSLSQSSFAGNMYESAILSGLTGSNSLLSGDLSKRAALRGQIAILLDLQGSLVMNAVLSGQVSVESVLSGNVIIVDEGILSLSGSVDAQTALSGNLSVLKQLRGIIESQTNLSGSVIQQASLSGDVLTVSATSAEAVVAQTLSGAAFVSSELSGELSRLGEAWVGRIDITNNPMHTIQFKIKPMHTIQIQVKS